MVLVQARAEGIPTFKRASFILVAALAAPSLATATGGPDHVEFYVDGNDVAIAYRELADGGGWRLPTGDAVLLDERWWTPLGPITPIEAPRITTPAPALLRGIRGDRLTAVTAGDVDRDGDDELVISFRRPFRRNHINITRPRRAWVDDEGLSAHLGLYRPDDLAEVWAAGGKLSLAQLLRCRLRYFCDGLALGRESYVEWVFAKLRDQITAGRESGARRMVGCDSEGLREMRALRERPIDPGDP